MAIVSKPPGDHHHATTAAATPCRHHLPFVFLVTEHTTTIFLIFSLIKIFFNKTLIIIFVRSEYINVLLMKTGLKLVLKSRVGLFSPSSRHGSRATTTTKSTRCGGEVYTIVVVVLFGCLFIYLKLCLDLVEFEMPLGLFGIRPRPTMLAQIKISSSRI